MTADLVLLAWVGIFILPTAVAFARGGLFGIGWWALANLLLGWHPTLYIVLLCLAFRRAPAELGLHGASRTL